MKLKQMALSYDSTHYCLMGAIYPVPFISSQGLQNVAAQCQYLTALSLVATVATSAIGDLDSDDICTVLENCSQLVYLEIVGILNIKVDELIIGQPLALKHFSLWRSDLDATTDSNDGLLRFLETCPNLRTLVCEDILGRFSSMPLMDSLTSRLVRMPLERLFLSFNEFYEDSLRMLCNGVRGVEIQLFDITLSPGEEGKLVESMALPTDSHVVWKYEIPTIGHPDSCKLLMDIYSMR